MDYRTPTAASDNRALTYGLSPVLPLGAIVEVQKLLLLK